MNTFNKEGPSGVGRLLSFRNARGTVSTALALTGLRGRGCVVWVSEYIRRGFCARSVPEEGRGADTGSERPHHRAHPSVARSRSVPQRAQVRSAGPVSMKCAGTPKVSVTNCAIDRIPGFSLAAWSVMMSGQRLSWR